MNKPEYAKKWRLLHPERAKFYSQRYYQSHKDERNAYRKLYRQRLLAEKPWTRTYFTIQRRLNGAKHRRYKELAYIEIEMHLTCDDLKQLWFRDEPWKMKFPTIDRIDPTQHYTFDNCRYIEMSANRSRVIRSKKILLDKS